MRETIETKGLVGRDTLGQVVEMKYLKRVQCNGPWFENHSYLYQI